MARLPSRAETTRTYDSIADSFAATRTTPWPEVVGFESRLSRGLLILDVACGSARHTKVLANRHRVVGLDSAGELLAHARRNEPRASYVLGDMVSLPFPPNTFDAAICIASVHHLATESERLAAVTELRRILRPAGKALITVWSLEAEDFADHAARGEADVWVPWRGGGPPDAARFYHLFREGELEALCVVGGFQGERFFGREGNWIAEVAKPWRT